VNDDDGYTNYPASMTESQLMWFIERLCKQRGILCWHAPDSRRQIRGFPDLLLIGARGVLWRELKSWRGALTAEQRGFGSRLISAKQDWATWRPHDLVNGTIRRQLDAIAP
jgi:hypothetical protein